MNRLKNSLIFSSLILLLTFEVVAYPVFPITLNKKSSEVTESLISQQPELPDVKPVFQKGLSYSCWSNDDFGSSVSDESLSLLTETGTEWIALCFSWIQSNTSLIFSPNLLSRMMWNFSRLGANTRQRLGRKSSGKR